MDYRIRHTTTYRYGNPVSVCHNLLTLTPRVGPRVRCPRCDIDIRPQPTTVNRRVDGFGNVVHVFSIEAAHEQLTIDARSHVAVDPLNLPALAPTPPWEAVAAGIAEQTDPDWLALTPFVFDSPRVRRTQAAHDYARRAFADGLPIYDAAVALTDQVHRGFAYTPGATHVDTDSDEALDLQKGVCQDFAHVQLAGLRSLGVPARYVSGYLRTVPPPGKPRLVGADQSHAWVSAYCGPSLGWVDFDPTNNVVCDTDHVPLAYARDYTDVAPVRGAFLGGGDSVFSVQVDVAPASEDPAAPAP